MVEVNDLTRFLVNHAVQSKVANEVVVGVWNNNPIIFIHGYPMTQRGFIQLATKAVMGDNLKFAPQWWAEIHLETAMLCERLPLKPTAGREAFDVLQGIRDHLKTLEGASGTNYLLEWVASVENKIEEAVRAD